MSNNVQTVKFVIRHPLTAVRVEGISGAAGGVVTGVALGEGDNESADEPCDRALRSAARLLRGYLDGEVRDLGAVAIDFSRVTPFQRHILEAARTIPWGCTVTYGALAARAGVPRAVRAAATVMRRNPFPLIVPCHRVVAAGGIGGFMGDTSGEAVELKRRLLEHEGISRPAPRFGGEEH